MRPAASSLPALQPHSHLLAPALSACTFPIEKPDYFDNIDVAHAHANYEPKPFVTGSKAMPVSNVQTSALFQPRQQAPPRVQVQSRQEEPGATEGPQIRLRPITLENGPSSSPSMSTRASANDTVTLQESHSVWLLRT